MLSKPNRNWQNKSKLSTQWQIKLAITNKYCRHSIRKSEKKRQNTKAILGSQNSSEWTSRNRQGRSKTEMNSEPSQLHSLKNGRQPWLKHSNIRKILSNPYFYPVANSSWQQTYQLKRLPNSKTDPKQTTQSSHCLANSYNSADVSSRILSIWMRQPLTE